MPSSVNSIYFLWAAYLVVVLANVGFVFWLRRRWMAIKREDPND